MKKLVIFSFSVLLLTLGVFAVNAATFQGPPQGCYDPSGTGCNLDGVIWNRSTSAPQAQDASYYISGDTRTGGNARIGTGLQVDSGNASIAGEVIANFSNSANVAKLNNIGDLELKSSKAINVDSLGTAVLNIGNFFPGSGDNIDVNIYGNLRIKDTGANPTPQICLDGACITSWPSGGGGGGDVTDVLQGSGITVTSPAGPQPNVSLDLSYTDGRYFVRDDQLDNNAGIYSRNGRIGAMDISGGNSNFPYLNIGGGYLGYYESTSYWSVSPQILFRNSVSMLGGNVSIGQLGGDNLQILGIVSGNTRYNVGGNNSSFCLSSGGTTCSSWSPTLGAVRGDQLCIGTDCRNAWPAGGGSGDITAVNAGTGITGGGVSGDVTLNIGASTGIDVAADSIAITPSYRLPQSCGSGQTAKYNGSSWYCATDNDSGGDITNVTASTGLTGGGSTGALSLGISSSYQLPQACSVGQLNIWNGSQWACTPYPTGGTGDVTSVQQSTGITVTNPGGPDPLVAVSQTYRMPQGCSSGQVAEFNSSSQIWQCATDNDSGGDITGVTAGNGLTGGGTVGTPTLSVDETRYVNTSGNEIMTGQFHVNNNTDASLSTHGALVLGSTNVANMVLDGNEIQARSNGSASTIHINYDGGNIITGDGMIMLAPTYMGGGKIGMGVDPTSLGYKLNLPSDGGVFTRGTARATAWHTFSDNRVKFNQKTSGYGISEILKLQPKQYDQHASDFIDNSLVVGDDYTHQIGLIAQEVYPLIPEAVFKPENENTDLWSLDYEKLIPVTIKAIQEQQFLISNLQNENDMLKSKIYDLETRLEKIEFQFK